MQRPMKAPSARNSSWIGFPAPMLAARVKMTPMAIDAITQGESNRSRELAIITSVRNRLDLVVVVAVAAIANFSYFILSNGDFYYPDSFTYLAPARNPLQGLGFVDHLHQVETIRTPG